jgi:hypothetical protein
MSIHQLIMKSAQAGADAYLQIAKRNNSLDKVIEGVRIRELSLNHLNANTENHRFWQAIDGGDRKALTNTLPCLYAFEICDSSIERNTEILSAYKAYKTNAAMSRNVSAAKSHSNLNTKYLYVGKVKHGINGRMANHLGYSNPKTGALQLIHWAAEINLVLNVHLQFLPPGTEDYLPPLEYLLAGELKPLLGKHK